VARPIDILGEATLDGPHGRWQIRADGDTVTAIAPTWSSVKAAPSLPALQSALTAAATHGDVRLRVVVTDTNTLAAETGRGVQTNMIARIAGLPDYRVPLRAAWKLLTA